MRQDGSEAELREQIDAAKRDWRDVLNAAEYPEASRRLLEYSKLDETTRERVDKRNREQYLAWLGKDERPAPRANMWHKLWPRKRST